MYGPLRANKTKTKQSAENCLYMMQYIQSLCINFVNVYRDDALNTLYPLVIRITLPKKNSVYMFKMDVQTFWQKL